MTALQIAAARARQLARILRPFDAVASLPELEIPPERDPTSPAVADMIARGRERVARRELRS